MTRESIIAHADHALSDSSKRLTDYSHPLRWIVSRAIDVSLDESLVAAA
jgi:hypothetical protein